VYKFRTFLLTKNELIANLPFYSVRYRQNKFSSWMIGSKIISELRAEVRNNINGHFNLDWPKIT
jgi:hypothetical protein